MKKYAVFGLLVVFGVLFSFADKASAKSSDPAVSFVENLSTEFITKIFNDKSWEKQKVDNFRKTFLKNCDLDFISKFVLGKAWRTAKADERKSFTAAFSENVVLTWAGRFKEYNGQTIKVTGTRPAQSGQIYVDSQVISPVPNTVPIALIWRLENVAGDYKIVDLVIEGVSMAMSYRNEYAAVLQASGGSINKLSETLQAKNQALAKGLGI